MEDSQLDRSFWLSASRDRGCWLLPQLSLVHHICPAYLLTPPLGAYPEGRESAGCLLLTATQASSACRTKPSSRLLWPWGLTELHPCLDPSTSPVLGVTWGSGTTIVLTPHPRLCLQSCFNHSSFLVDTPSQSFTETQRSLAVVKTRQITELFPRAL